MYFDLKAHTVLLTLSGSRAFGLEHPGSDVDLKGVAIAPIGTLLSAFGTFEQVDDAGELAVFLPDLTEAERREASTSGVEGAVYDLRKFLRLAAEANPNILEVLFCRDQEVRWMTPLGRRLRSERGRFLSARAKHTFSGYAASQLKRIQTHRRWLRDPPEHEPLRAEYGLPERTLIPQDQLAAAMAEIRRKVDSWEIDFGALPEAEKIHLQERMATVLSEIGVSADARWMGAARGIGCDENFLLLLDRERRYLAARREWAQFQGWKHNRNPKRATLEQRHGYDTKHAAHLVRLLRMCRELLTRAAVHVWRGDIDADEIRRVQDGDWSYEKLVAWAEEENRSLDDIVASKACVVPRAPDVAAIDALCTELTLEFHRLRGEP